MRLQLKYTFAAFADELLGPYPECFNRRKWGLLLQKDRLINMLSGVDEQVAEPQDALEPPVHPAELSWLLHGTSPETDSRGGNDRRIK